MVRLTPCKWRPALVAANDRLVTATTATAPAPEHANPTSANTDPPHPMPNNPTATNHHHRTPVSAIPTPATPIPNMAPLPLLHPKAPMTMMILISLTAVHPAPPTSPRQLGGPQDPPRVERLGSRTLLHSGLEAGRDLIPADNVLEVALPPPLPLHLDHLLVDLGPVPFLAIEAPPTDSLPVADDPQLQSLTMMITMITTMTTM